MGKFPDYDLSTTFNDLRNHVYVFITYNYELIKGGLKKIFIITTFCLYLFNKVKECKCYFK